MNFFIIPNMTRKNSFSVTNSLLNKLEELNCGVFFETEQKKYFGDRKNIIYNDDSEYKKSADMFISVGGDGSFINAAKIATIYHKPLIWVNAGKLAYMACIEGD